MYIRITEKGRNSLFWRISKFLWNFPGAYWRHIRTNRTFLLMQLSSIGLALIVHIRPKPPLFSFTSCFVGFLVAVLSDFKKTRKQHREWKEQKRQLEFFITECQRLSTEFNKTPDWDTATRRALAEQFDVARVRFERAAKSAFGDDWTKS